MGIFTDGDMHIDETIKVWCIGWIGDIQEIETKNTDIIRFAENGKSRFGEDEVQYVTLNIYPFKSKRFNTVYIGANRQKEAEFLFKNFFDEFTGELKR